MKNIINIFAIDLRSLALFRICLGLVILADLFIRFGDLQAHYTDFGVLSRDAIIRYSATTRFSLHMASGAAWFQSLLFLIAAIFASSLIIGFKTRTSTFISWILLLSLQNRNFLLLQGGDNLLLLLLFWSMLLPLGARFSVDKALNTTPNSIGNHYISIGTAAILIQVMSVYFFSAFLKSGPEWYPEGTALYYTLNLATFTTPVGAWLLQFTTLNKLISLYVWLLELLGPLIIFSPIFSRSCRTTVMVLFILLELSFIICLKVGLFPFISITSLLLFMPGYLWDFMVKKTDTDKRQHLHIYYPVDSESSKKLCLFLQTFLLIPKLTISPLSNIPIQPISSNKNFLWLSSGQEDSISMDCEALSKIFNLSPVFFPFAYFFKLQIIQRFTRIFFQNTNQVQSPFTRLTQHFFPYHSTSYNSSYIGQFLAFVSLLYITYWNITTLPQVSNSFPKSISVFSKVLRLDQKWSMFAPAPTKIDVSIAIQGKLKDGTRVDVLNMTEGAPDWAELKKKPMSYKNYRWRKLLRRLRLKRYKKYRLYYGRYLCRIWNQDTEKQKKLKNFKIYAILQRTLPELNNVSTERYLIWKHQCFKK